ncbi:MAG TPA: hypothetical protein VMR66_08290 [Gemmatimonadota bacterium]|nr:hypothetical protein [Gemmatimonadota bacterium]
MQTRIVVLHADGRRIKGFSRVFNPLEPVFHVRVADASGETGEVFELRFADVQAVFFVRDFAFDRDRREDYEPERDLGPMTRPPDVGGQALEVDTTWGETLVGLTYDYQSNQPGFFLFPTDPMNRTLNLERAYLLNSAVTEVRSTEPEG